jgi:hypothetical protein
MGVDSGLLVQDKDVVAGRGELDLGEEVDPLDIRGFSITTNGDDSSINRTSRSLVTSEVVGIDIKTLEGTGETELDDTPIPIILIIHVFCLFLPLFPFPIYLFFHLDFCTPLLIHFFFFSTPIQCIVSRITYQS